MNMYLKLIKISLELFIEKSREDEEKYDDERSNEEDNKTAEDIKKLLENDVFNFLR